MDSVQHKKSIELLIKYKELFLDKEEQAKRNNYLNRELTNYLGFEGTKPLYCYYRENIYSSFVGYHTFPFFWFPEYNTPSFICDYLRLCFFPEDILMFLSKHKEEIENVYLR